MNVIMYAHKWFCRIIEVTDVVGDTTDCAWGVLWQPSLKVLLMTAFLFIPPLPPPPPLLSLNQHILHSIYVYIVNDDNHVDNMDNVKLLIN